MSAYRLFTSTSAVWCTLMLALSLGWINPAQASESQEYEAQLRPLQHNIQRLQRELAAVQGARDERREQLQKSESEIGTLLKSIERSEQQLRREEQELRSLHQERSELQLAPQARQQEVSYQIRAASQLGRQSPVKLLLKRE